MNVAIIDDPAWRTRTDPIGEAAVLAILAEGGPALLNKCLALLSNEPPQGAWPKGLQDFVQAVPVPTTVDQARIENAQLGFMTFGVLGVSILACASLPETYCLPGIAKLLGMSGQLTEHVGRRLEMTGQMLFDVMAPEGLKPGGKALKSILRTRLMHAALRYMLLNELRVAQKTDDDLLREEVLQWTGEYGQPINQMELVYTLMTFSHVVLRSAETMGIQPETDTFEDYVYTWNVVGQLLGIDDALLPTSRAEASALFERIKAAHGRSTKESRDLMAKLEDYWVQDWPALLRPMAGPVMNSLCERMLSPDTRAMLAITPARTFLQHETDLLMTPVAAGFRLAQRVFHALPSTAHLAATVTQHWANRRVDVPDGGLEDSHQHMLDAWFEREAKHEAGA